jgi:hypothetical protein
VAASPLTGQGSWKGTARGKHTGKEWHWLTNEQHTPTSNSTHCHLHTSDKTQQRLAHSGTRPHEATVAEPCQGLLGGEATPTACLQIRHPEACLQGSYPKSAFNYSACRATTPKPAFSHSTQRRLKGSCP